MKPRDKELSNTIIAAITKAIQATQHNVQAKTKKKSRSKRTRGARATGAATAVLDRPILTDTGRTVANSQPVRFRGSERLATIDVAANAAGIVTTINIGPRLTARLARMTSCYQRVKYKSMRFKVASKFASSTSGGYLAGVIADADDTFVTLDELAAQKGSKSVKWWDSISINVPVTDELKYTSAGSDARESSLGTFAIMVDGIPNTSGSMTLSVDYDVVCSKATYEQETAPVANCVKAVYTKADDIGLADDNGGTAAADIRACFTGLPEHEQMYRLQSTAGFTVQSGTGNTDTRVFRFVLWSPDTTRALFASFNGLVSNQSESVIKNLVIYPGDKIVPVHLN